MAEPRSIHEALSAGDPAASAIAAPGRRTLAREGLCLQVEAVVGALRTLGTKRSERIAMVLPNGPEMAVAFLGVASGAVAAPLNTAYRARFGFPFVICVRLHSRDQILAAMRRRLEAAPDAETEEAIRQIHDIARLRLDDLLARLEA